MAVPTRLWCEIQCVGLVSVTRVYVNVELLAALDRQNEVYVEGNLTGLSIEKCVLKSPKKWSSCHTTKSYHLR
jgi:hypothetical protein